MQNERVGELGPPRGRHRRRERGFDLLRVLGSDEAAYISGAVLAVDGGLMAGMNVMIDEFILEAKDD